MLDGKPVCLNCGESIAVDELNTAQRSRVWALIKFLFSGFFLAIAIMAYTNGVDIKNVWIIAGISGLPTAFKVTRRSKEQRIMDDIHDRYTGDMMDLMFGWVIRLLLKIVFVVGLAPICAVYTFVSNLIAYISYGKKIKEAKGTLEYIDQCLNDSQQPSVNGTSQFQMPSSSDHIQQSGSQILPGKSVQTSESSNLLDASSVVNVPPNSLRSFQAPASSQTYKDKNGKKLGKIFAIIIGVVVLLGIVPVFVVWYLSYKEDKDALRSYVVANNVFLRSSKESGVEYNILSKIPYGSELITYSKDPEWAEIKVNGIKGFVASPYLLDWSDFKLLNDVWGSADAKEYIESSKCRFAILDYCKRNNLNTGKEGWQLYTLEKDIKPNNVIFPRLNNGYDKFTEFAFILKNNTTKDRKLALYSFDEETEAPVFLYEEDAPEEAHINQIKYNSKKYSVSYTNESSGNIGQKKGSQKKTNDSKESLKSSEITIDPEMLIVTE